MKIKAVYINTYKYDFRFARICIASIRYWYPDIPVILIKDRGAGDFDTSTAEKLWGIDIYETNRSKFGWGYGKWEPMFEKNNFSFLVLDADTVITGPVLNVALDVNTQFIVDEEVQPVKRFNEIYYNLSRINEIDKDFVYPGYSFNEGQWFGTAGIFTREDFAEVVNWNCSPPQSKYPGIIYQGAQGHLNFMLHKKVKENAVTLTRKKIMIWPDGSNADFLSLDKIKSKSPEMPFIIHWAGMRFNTINDLPRTDILKFYLDYYNSKLSFAKKIKEHFYLWYILPFVKKLKLKF